MRKNIIVSQLPRHWRPSLHLMMIMQPYAFTGMLGARDLLLVRAYSSNSLLPLKQVLQSERTSERYKATDLGKFIGEPLNSKDGMDQSKWSLPRNRVVQSSKETSAIIRPRMKIHGLWVHGVSLNLYIVHPGVPSDSSLICECFARALQDTANTFERSNKKMPRECLVWALWLQHIPTRCR